MTGTIDTILSRRSVREFKEKEIDDVVVEQILEAGRWAPSGLNNQPWRFMVIKSNNTIEKLSKLTHYTDVVKNAPLLIAIFLDQDSSYNYVKDVQAIGAAIQNMLLASVELGTGSVWLGEILNQKEKVNEVLDAPSSLELMAIIAIGYPVEKDRTSARKPLEELVYYEKYSLKKNE
ncbi:nitroreductase [Methanosalsum zhilinae DSM 4017]|uniref:Nitroreductase n=1 Tax=Methanosalsum zhilinae (strain DSM 4017 / NBRC 107636 / OCM 62 / WeN5) TaxID=679901 RepID=F7XQ32_METZD|nr:nitroreductase [Methanosalsum zhilinae]AEH60393.1 nitroreductase [Methanosalsum zhilinae DSM 4017]